MKFPKRIIRPQLRPLFQFIFPIRIDFIAVKFHASSVYVQQQKGFRYVTGIRLIESDVSSKHNENSANAPKHITV